MAFLSPSLALDTVCALLGLYALHRLLVSRRTGPLPPGPKGLPLIGNILDWPKDKPWETFTAWRELYGDFVYCNLFGQPVVVLNNAQLVQELLDRKGANYSERPHQVFASDLVGWKDGPASAPYGKRLKAIRGLLNKAAGSRAAVARHAQKAERSAAWLVVNILKRPDKLEEVIRRTIGTGILIVSHGYAATDGLDPDPFVELADRAMAVLSKSLRPGAYLVDVIPFLRFVPGWVPGAGFQREAVEMRKTVEEFLNRPHAWVKEQMAAGTARPSFVADELTKKTMTPYEDNILAWAAAAFYGAGTDTSASALYTFFLAMTLHPEVQNRAKAELDAVIGSERLPELSDRDNLPYVNAICLEVLRWGWILPLGLPHVAKEADMHAGYLIPKGTIVIPNIWSFTHDPERYHDPMAFIPERFLPSSDGRRKPEQDPHEFVFGFGRRVCPGAALADANIFIIAAVVLATLDTKPEVDAMGVPMLPEVEFTTGVIARAKPFQCSFAARSKNAEDMVNRALHGLA